jgi:hypothetical protein
MIRAACHCEAVKFEISEPPEWVLDCNCTLCRRYGVLWSYYHPPAGQAKLLMQPDPAASETYSWGDRGIAFRRCKTCGCMTHMQTTDIDPPMIFGVNARMMSGLDPATVRIRRKDNGCSGFFWTRPDEPVIPGSQGPMPPPSFEDWR